MNKTTGNKITLRNEAKQDLKLRGEKPWFEVAQNS